MQPLAEPPTTEIPLYGPLALPPSDAVGPPDGLTLDGAVALLLRDNLELRARALELPQAEADITTAGLRPNPILFADAQLIPYGNFSERNPGGPTQYDVNITYPIDFSGKRRARVLSASQTRRALGAQYQDAVRLQVDNLYGAFVDLIAAREAVRFAQTSVTGLEDLLIKSESLYREGTATKVDVNRFRIQRETAQLAQADAQEAFRRARRAIGTLLNMPPEQSGAIEPRGSLRVTSARPLPPVEQLVEIALDHRPDLLAFRLGINLANADLKLAMASRFEDVFLLYQPFTLQDNYLEGVDRDPWTSWAVGMTIPLPVFNRNQGNIRRAQINVAQTQTEHLELQHRIIAEVLDATSEHAVSLASVRRIEEDLLGIAREIVDDSYRLYVIGEVDALAYLGAQRDYNDVVRQYFSALVRHRRGMLGVNTAVGQRLLP